MTPEQGYPDAPIHELFERQAAKTPDRIALINGEIGHEQRITFAELNERANRFAWGLIERGVKRETFVGLSIERSIPAVVALIGILKAGGAYVYLDPAYPQRRLREMARDAGLDLIITDRLEDSREQTTNLNAGVDLDNAAYVIYTSGSTGRPKGAVQVHRSMVSRLISRPLPDIRSTDVCCLNSSLSFGISASRLFFPLVEGAPVVLLGEESVKDVHRFLRALDTHQVTSAFMVPALLRQVLTLEEQGVCRLPSLRAVAVSGGSLTPDLVDRFRRAFPEALLVNMYGSTEIGTSAAMRVIDSAALSSPVSIGRAAPNTRIYILDRDLNPVSDGETGEICVAARHLAREYLNLPELTAERFIADPFTTSPHGSMCRTGDLGRYLPNGEIEFLGRADHQVKIRGYRIELGEIEAVLLSHPSIEEAAVTAPGVEDERRLAAYLVCKDSIRPAKAELRAFLAERLPEHMIPSVFMTLRALPLTDAGKINRGALPDPIDIGGGSTDGIPETQAEKAMAQLWRQFLRVDSVCLHDNFIEQGGDSLGATQLLAAIRGQFGVEIPARLLFDGTLGELARAVDR